MIPHSASTASAPQRSVDPTAPLTIVHAASEVVGFAKTGGLADVVGSLPRALAQRGHRCVIFLPLYRSVRTGPVPLTPTEYNVRVPIGKRTVPGRLCRARRELRL